MGWASALKKAPSAPLVTKKRETPLTVVQPQTVYRPKVKLADVDFKTLVTIDFETYFDDDYTLRKLSTSEYVRDERFRAHMMGIKIGTRKRRVVPHDKILDALLEIDWSTHTLLCHNTAFDGLILSHHYGVIPAYYYDTLSMARGLHSNDIGASLDEVAQFYALGNKIPNVLTKSKGILKLPKALYTEMANYCGMDVDLTVLVFAAMLQAYPQREIELVDCTIRMFCDPVLEIDREMVAKEHAREVQAKRDLFLSIVGSDSDVFEDMKLLKGKEKLLEGDDRIELMAKRVLGSGEKFANLLRAEGVEPGVKISKSWMQKKADERDDSKKWTYAFAKDDPFMVELLDDDNERVVMLAEARIAVKSTGNVTKAWRFLEATKNGWKLPVGLSYYRAHTGRWGGNNKMNMQNMKRGGVLREAIYAPKGHVVAVQDSGQIEARVNGWLWDQTDLLEAFAIADAYEASQMKLTEDQRQMATGDDRDAYCRFADLVYGFEVTKANKTERFVGKTCVLGLGFQMGANKLQGQLAKGGVKFELEFVKKMVNTYRRKNYKITQGWEICAGIIEDMAMGHEGSHKCIHWEKEKIWLPNGMALKYPGLKKEYNEESGWEEWSYNTPLGRKKIYGGLLCENIVQALARIIVAEQMLQIQSRGYRIVMMTHDEVVAIAPKRQAEKCIKTMAAAMSVPLEWCPDLPVNCEGGYADNYSK